MNAVIKILQFRYVVSSLDIKKTIKECIDTQARAPEHLPGLPSG